MRILGLDPGEKRIGVAVSDAEGVLACPLQVLERKSRARDLEEIRSLVCQLQVERIVVGNPLNMNGSEGFQASRAIRLAKEIQEETQIPVILWDERLSTQSALNLRKERLGRRRRGSGATDAVAAAFILQSYLDSERER